MAKGKKDDAKKPTITAVSTSLASKMDHRERQAAKDRAVSVDQDGWKPRKTVTEKDRCGACGHPSAVIRQGGSLCTRCQGEPARARGRQDTREAKKNQPNARPAQKTGRPASPLAAALTPAAGIAAAIANIVAPFVA